MAIFVGKHYARVLVLVAHCLLDSCQHPDKDPEHSYRPEPEMEASMLSIQDIPGATSVSWEPGAGDVITSCPSWNTSQT